MKKMRKLLTGLAVAAMTVSLVIPVQAGKYKYSFSLSAGTQGVLDSSAPVEFEGEATVTFVGNAAASENPQGGTVNVTDAGGNLLASYKVSIPETAEDAGKYYVKGIRKSGRDQILNKETISKDADYVVAYGVMKNPVQYTVYYRDANGRDLLDPQTFTASVGDKPVVACQDIDGYMPNALNMTGTLEADAASNAFIFVYSPIPGSSGGVVTNEETETVTNTTTQIVPAENAGAEGGAAGGGMTVVPGEGGDAQAEAGGAGEEAAGAEETPAEPQELIDLDDEEVPLANVPGSNGGIFGVGEPGSFFVSMPPAVIVGVVSLAVLAVAAAWYLLFMKKKRTNAGNEEK